MYKVITAFIDASSHVAYSAGDEFPRPGASATRKRIEELKGSQNKAGHALIEEVVSEVAEVAEETEMPRRRGRKRKNDDAD